MPLCLKRVAAEQSVELRGGSAPASVFAGGLNPQPTRSLEGEVWLLDEKTFCSKVLERFLFHYMAERLSQIR